MQKKQNSQEAYQEQQQNSINRQKQQKKIQETQNKKTIIQVNCKHQNKVQFLQFDQEIKTLVHNKLKDSFQSTQINLSFAYLNQFHLKYAVRQSINNKLFNPKIVKMLDLSLNNLTDEGIKQLCKKECQWKDLKQLYLQYNNITMKGVQYLSESAQMKLLPQLSQLSLASNNIGGHPFTLLVNIQSQQYSKSQGLLLKFAGSNTKLSILHLRSNKLNDKDMKILFSFKENNKESTKINERIFHHLQQLILFNNCITKCQIKEFIGRQLTQQYPSLKRLLLHKNKLNKYGIKYLIESINKNKNHKLSQLQFLSLNENNLCSQAIKLLVSNKNALGNIKHLVLNENPLIQDQGFNYFIKACQEGSFSLLETLQIQNINLSDIGHALIIKQFHLPKFLTSLQSINLKNNKKIINLLTAQKILQRKWNRFIQSQHF